jgi:NADH-quinone oxidoreductase subunit J
MGLTQILFWILSAITIGSALMVIFSKNPVYSVLFLIVTFFAISGHYILLNAQFLAIVNIIVYAGAIMVLFLFVVMLMNLNKQAEPRKNIWMILSAVISGGALLLVIVYAAKETSIGRVIKAAPIDIGGSDIGLIEVLGKKLFTQYVIPFEISSVLFLSAMIGAVILGKKEKTTQP